MSKGALVIGSGKAGIQAGLDLADSGIFVHLVESSQFLGGDGEKQLQPHKLNTRLLEVIRHPNIKIWTNTTVQKLKIEGDEYQVELHQHPRFVDLKKCTACGDCIDACPVTLVDQEPGSDMKRKAISLDGQPGCAAIQKPGIAPCAGTCPGGIHVQGYVALIAQKRYREAIDLILDAIPFPSVCGRVCNHYCEAECSRGKVDEAVNIMALKRFVADWAFENQEDMAYKGKDKPGLNIMPSGYKVAIIGAGPAGLTAARGLVRLGHEVIVYDALPTPGGMMRVGIPPHRLPHELLDWEIQQILNEGVKLVLNTWIDDIPGLLEEGFDAVLIATGAHKAKKLPIKNSDHPDNHLSLDVLRSICLGDERDFKGKKIVVLGGGNVALDTARTVIRLGAKTVRMVSLEPRGEMPGFAWEIEVAEEEGIEMFPGRSFTEIVLGNESISGVRCMKIDFHGFDNGRPRFDVIQDSEHIIPADIVIWAIGQEPDFSFLPDSDKVKTNMPSGIETDENMMTTMQGLFVAGDVHRGMTFFVIDAIGEGNKVAHKINQYLQGNKDYDKTFRLPKVHFTPGESIKRFTSSKASNSPRVQISSIPLESREHTFDEVDLTLTEDEALSEASRCLVCGDCSECLACEKICSTGAINHSEQIFQKSIGFGKVIFADHTNFPGNQEQFNNGYIHQIPPDDALSASAAAAETMLELFGNRQPLPISSTPILQGPINRIGVFICECGNLISNHIDIRSVVEHISNLPDVLHVQTLRFTCHSESASIINKTIKDHNLDGVVVAACSCCNVDQVCFSCTYQRVRCKENLDIFSPTSEDWRMNYSGIISTRIEFVNIREQCAWVHGNKVENATTKTKKLVTATVARVKSAPAVLAGARSIEKSILIIGSGPAVPFCKSVLDKLGIKVHQIKDKFDSIHRLNGSFAITQETKEWLGSAILLIPENSEEIEKQLAAFGRERRRPHIHLDWGGPDTHRPGVYFIDPNHEPQIAGFAAAARVVAWISRRESHPHVAAIVNPARCRACKTCIDTCEYCAPELIEINGRYTSWIDPAICISCGTCAAHCPSGAISAGCSTDAQIEAMLDAILM